MSRESKSLQPKHLTTKSTLDKSTKITEEAPENALSKVKRQKKGSTFKKVGSSSHSILPQIFEDKQALDDYVNRNISTSMAGVGADG